MSAEDVRYAIAIGNASAAPVAYDDRYRLPIHSDKSLQLRFAHPIDKELRFYEKPHIYTFRGRCATASVSGLIKPYCEEFNSMLIISRMRASKREAWPRLKYAHGVALIDDVTQVTPGTLVLIVNTELTKYAGPVETIPYRVEGDVVYTYERALTDAEITVKWADPEARNRGTEAHYQVELYLNSLPTVEDFPELEFAKDFMRDQLVPIGAKAFRTEWEIFAPEEDVAGSIDAVFVMPSGELIIVDWKRSAKLKANVHSLFSKRLRHPFQHVDDCDVAKYAFQLSIYAWILEKYYGYRISGLCLVCIHPDAPFHTWCPYLKLEVDLLMRKRREVAAARIALTAYDTALPRCELTGQIAFDAVKTEDGRIVNEKDLAVHEEHVQYGVDRETRNTCRMALQRIFPAEKSVEEVRLEAERVPWKLVIPVDGVQVFTPLPVKMA